VIARSTSWGEEDPRRGGLDAVVKVLASANTGALRRSARQKPQAVALPSAPVVREAVEGLRSALFPWHFGALRSADDAVERAIERPLRAALAALREQIRVGVLLACEHDRDPCPECAASADRALATFTQRLPEVRALVESDAWAAFDGDPAATSADEALFCYPGITASFHHRLAHELHRLDVPLIPRMISELAHAATGIDIHPAARIGASFFVDHGTGVVIGETCVIGDRVRLYQGVTLGSRTFPLDEDGRPIKGVPRHPIVEDDVVIYAGATLLGRITIGRGSSVGGNVWVTRSLAPHTHVTQARFRHDMFDGGAGI
jgi:serine O-acetyltransferase